MARLAPDLPDSYADSLTALKSMGAVVLVVTLDRQLTQYYWHSLPKEAGFPFLALVEHTNFIPPEHYGGDHIIYCGDYLNPDHEYFQMSKEELLERFLPVFNAFNPDFDRSWVKDIWLWKDGICSADPAGQPFAEHPADQDARAGSLFRQHEPGLPVGSRDELRRRDRARSGADGDGRFAGRRYRMK